MSRVKNRCTLHKVFRSSRGIALPVTFLLLFVSLTLLISATYYFSMIKISAKSQEFRVSGAENQMLSLEKVVRSVLWSPGSYEVYDFSDLGGELRVLPNAKRLMLNLTDNSSFNDVFFNSVVGKAVYEVSSSEIQDYVFLVGDNRPVLNQSSSTMAQLYISHGVQSYGITLSYRPLAGSAPTGSVGGKPANSIRVYVVNLNSSQILATTGNFRLKVSCVSVTSNLQSYNFTSPLSSLTIKADLDGVLGEVSLPISSTSSGTVVNVETVTCNIRLENVGW